MKRIVAVVAALGLAVSACGSGSGGDAGSDATAEETAEETADASSEEGSTAEETAEPEETEESAADVTTTTDQIEGSEGTAGQDDISASTDEGDDDNGDDAVSAGRIQSIGDIPEACRDQMLNFLRDVEPIVSDIDWQTATFAEFEAIIGEFEAISAEFEQQNVVTGCDDLEFADDREFELMIEFAENEAPGTVGFLQFLAQVNQTTGGDTGDGSATDAGFADCQGAIDFVQGLIDEYDSFADVPATAIVKFSSLAAIFVTCSPEQLEFFDSPEVNDFLS